MQAPLGAYGRPYGHQPVSGYSVPAGWLQQYAVMPPLATVDDHYTCQIAGAAPRDSPASAARGIPFMMGGDPNSVQYIPQLTAHMNALHVGTPGQVSHQLFALVVDLRIELLMGGYSG